MLDYKGIITNLTGIAKTTFHMTIRKMDPTSPNNRNNNNNNRSTTSTSSSGSSSSSRSRRALEARGRERQIQQRHGRLSSSEEARNTAIMGREVREDGMYLDENAADSPFIVLVSCYNIGEMVVEKSVELKKEKVEKKKKFRELNIPTRDMFAPDFLLQPDEDLPGFSPIDSEYDTDDDAFEAEELNRRPTPRHTHSMPPPLMGMNPEIPNVYDPVIGIISVQGVKIPRSQPIDIVPAREPLFPFFGVNTDLQVMLIAERMYDVFKERIRTRGKERMITMMENLAATCSIGQFCRRLLPVEMMDGVVFFYDYDTVSFLKKEELINILILCEPDKKDEQEVAASFPSMFHRETAEQKMERNRFYQELMNMTQIYLRRCDYMASSIDDMDFDFPFIESVDNELNQRLTIERQLNDDNMDHEEMSALIRTISQDLEEAERQQGIEFLHQSTLALFDARVMVPSVN